MNIGGVRGSQTDVVGSGGAKKIFNIFLDFSITNNESIKYLLYGLLGCGIWTILLAICESIVPFLYLRRKKKLRTAKTYKLQLMLYKASLVQIWLIVWLLIMPMLGIVTTIYMQNEYTSLLQPLFLAISSFHGLLEHIGLM